MSQEKSQSSVETVEPTTPVAGSVGRGQTVVNWVFALLTVPAALVVVFVAIGGVLSNAACSGHACSGPGSFVFAVLFYGAPVVAAVTVIASFFTATRRWGIAVPLCALALLAADLVTLIASF